MKITTNINLTGTEYPITIDVSKEINSIPNPNERMDKILDFLLSIDLTDANLSDWYIADFRNKMIALNAKFRFKSTEIAELFLSWYIEKIGDVLYTDVNVLFKDFVKEMGQPKIYKI